MKYDCILLAAGLSSRMSEWKLLRNYQGKSLIEEALDNASKYSNNMIISGGYRISELQNLFANRRNIRIVYNRDYEKGMMTSIKAALSFVTSDKFFVSLADMPLIPPEVYRDMSEINFKDVLFPVFEGRRGHPVLIKTSLRDAIFDFDDYGKMKDFLSEYDCVDFEVTHKGVLQDIDTDEEYALLIKQ